MEASPAVLMLLLAAFWIAWAFINLELAFERGKPAGIIFALSIIFSPLLMYLYLLASIPEKKVTD